MVKVGFQVVIKNTYHAHEIFNAKAYAADILPSPIIAIWSCLPSFDTTALIAVCEVAVLEENVTLTADVVQVLPLFTERKS